MIETTMNRETPLSLNHLLERAGRLYPESELVTRLPDKSLTRLTFADFHRRSRAFAAALREAGLQKGDRVATLCWNHHVHLECYFGIPAAGGVMHTLNLRLGAEELAWIMNHAEDRILVIDDVLLPLYEAVRDKVNLERVIVFPYSGAPVSDEFTDYEQFIAQAPEHFEYVPHDENDPVAMCYTSGTTGRPKGVVYSHRSTVLHTLTACLPETWCLRSDDSVLPVTPMFHANSWGMPYACVMLGLKMIFPGPHLHPEDLLDLFEAEQPTYSLGVPSIWLPMVELLDTQRERWNLPKKMRMLVGGSAMPEAAIRKFAAHGYEVTHGWGMTETSPLASAASVKPELQHLSEEERFPLYATAGIIQPLVDIRIVGDEGEQPWDGQSTGEIQVHGPFITDSYYNAPEAAEKFTDDGWLRTGDVATIDPHGYIRIVDRTKDLIKSGGEWISSVDLENALIAHPDVAEAAVIAVPHPKWTERPLACIVPRGGVNRIDEQELRDLLSQRFAKWQLPDAFIFMDELPHTSTGKLSKLTLRQMHADGRLAS